MGKKICLVTGATGFVGLNLLEALVNDHDNDWTILAVSRQARSRATCPVDHFLPASIASEIHVIQASLECDGNLKHTVDQKLQELHASHHDLVAIFHLVHLKESKPAFIYPGRVFFVPGYLPEGHDQHLHLNRLAMEQVLQVAESCPNARVVYCSSWSSYGIQPPGTMLVEDSTRDLSHQPLALGFFASRRQPIPYFVAKRNCEVQLVAAIQSGRIPAGVILQPASIFGKYCQAGWSRFFVLLMQTNGNMPALPGASSFCDAGQLAKAFCVAATSSNVPARGEAYLIGGTNASNLEMMQIMAQLVGVPMPSKATPAWLLMAMSRWNEMVLYYLPNCLAKRLFIKPQAVGCPFLTAKLCQSQGTLSQKAQDVLGYKPLSLVEILRGNYDWLVQEGVLPHKDTKKQQ